MIVPHPSDFNLPPGKSTAKGDLFDVSVFHQLHCLTKIREHAALLRFALEHNNTAGFEKIISPQIDHMAHCFDYLRQSIMCAGDMTLEWPKEGSSGERLLVDGWGIQHQCKSWVRENLTILWTKLTGIEGCHLRLCDQEQRNIDKGVIKSLGIPIRWVIASCAGSRPCRKAARTLEPQRGF